MRWLVSAALAIGLVGALLVGSSLVIARSAFVARSHALDAASGFALADPPPASPPLAPKQFEPPIPVEIEEDPYCAPWITVEPDGSATACGKPIAPPSSLDATAI